MLYICAACKFMFQSDKSADQCPDCGKKAVRIATPAEQQEYEERMRTMENWFDETGNQSAISHN